MALEKALEELEKLCVDEIKDPSNEQEVLKAVRTAVMSKQYGHEDFLAKLISRACISILMGKKGASNRFNVDNVRVCKILGSGLMQSDVVQVKS